MATPKVLFGCGDSIGGFHGDGGSTPVGQGLIQRLAWGGDGSNVLACFNMSKASSTVLQFNESTNNILDYWCQFATVFLGQRIINDLGVNPGNLITVSEAISRVQTSISIARGRGIKKFIQFLPGPATTSASTNWLNDADQTPQAGFAAGGRIWEFRAEVYKLVGEGGVDLVCPMTAFQSPTNKYVWKSDGTNDKYTADGTHPTALGHADGAAEGRTYVDALVMDDTLTASIGLELSHRNPETDLLESNPISDSSPNPFTIPAVTGAALSTLTTSANITPTGYTSAPISVSAGAEYSINDGAFTSSAGTIAHPSTVKVRVTSSGSNSTGVTGTLTIGDQSANFVVTTQAGSGAGTVVYSETFAGPSLPDGAYSTGSAVVSIYENALRIQYPANAVSTESFGAHGVGEQIAGLQQVYLEYEAKMPNSKWGMKFLKTFGERSTTVTPDDTYSNTTIGLDYTGVDYGSLYAISFGDGSTLDNDTASVIQVAGGVQASLGARNTSAVISCPKGSAFSSTDWGTGWHKFRIMIKFSSGTSSETDTPDGEYYLEIDDEVYVIASGLFNRSWQSLPMSYLELGGYTQGSNPAFDMSFRNLIISTGGFTS